MFGASRSDDLNALEQRVAERVDQRIKDAQDLGELVPPLPGQVAQLTSVLDDPTADFGTLQRIVESDVAISGEMIRLANSPLYKQASGEIEDLAHAVRSLGLANVVDIGTTVLMERVLHIQPVYFRRFGALIWDHSMQVAVLSKFLVGNDPQGHYYLSGLIHDVGKIVVFQALVGAFAEADPGEKPGSSAFKDMMTGYSEWLSWRVAEAWQMPAQVTVALKQQRYDFEESPTELGEILGRANRLSELALIASRRKLCASDRLMLAEEEGFDVDEATRAFEKLDDVAA